MSQSSAKRLTVSHRRRDVSAMLLRGATQEVIAEKLGVSQATVSRDVEWLHQQWKTESLYDIEALKERELRKVDHLENEAWEAWGRSQKPQQSADIAGDQERPTRKRVRNQYGDPRFLAIVNQCLLSRRTMLGLDKPRTMNDQEIDQLIMEEVDRLATAKMEFELAQRERRKLLEYKPTQEQADGNGYVNGAG